MEVTELFHDHDYCITTANDATTSNNDATACNYDTTADNNEVTACYNDATTDYDESLIHYDVKQEIDNPLTSHTKDSYDYVFAFDYPLNKIHEPTPRQRKQKLQAGVELQEIMEIKFLPNYIENQEMYNTHHKIKQEQEDPEVKMEVTSNNDATACNKEVTGCYNDAITDNDEPLIHYDVKQEIDNPLLENEYTVRYITEEELREKRFPDNQTPMYKRSPFKCEKCICYFYSHQSMRKHMKERHGKYAGRYMCRVCQQKFAEAGALSEHLRQHYVTYCCRECGFIDRRLVKMKRHLKEHAARQSGLTKESSAKKRRAERPKFICDHCGFESLWRHQIEEHFSLESNT